jgi:hypothetical protein
VFAEAVLEIQKLVAQDLAPRAASGDTGVRRGGKGIGRKMSGRKIDKTVDDNGGGEGLAPSREAAKQAGDCR